MFAKKIITKLVIGTLIVVCFFYGKNLNNWGHTPIIDNDAVSYYAYLPAAVLFHDLSFDFMKDLPADFDGKIWLETAPNGKPVIRMTMGLALLWLPFFLIAHLAANLLGVQALGYSWPYQLSIFVAAVFYLLVGLVFLRKILLKYFSEAVSAIVLLVVVLATNLMFYVISEPGMSHVYSFALITAFLFYTLKWIDQPNLLTSVGMGLLAGLIVLIRPVNGLVLIFPAAIAVSSLQDLKNRLTGRWKQILIAGLSAFVVVLPQLMYWKFQTGHFIFNSYMDSGRFYFASPNIWDGLFGFRKGWLVYTPVMLFSVAGLFLLKQQLRMFRTPLLIFLVLFIYVMLSWWCWWYGGSFGSRPMVDVYGLLALPLAAFVAFFLKRSWLYKIVMSLLLGAFIFLNQFQMSQYRTSLLHWDSMTQKAYFGIFLKKTWPEGYDKMIKIPDYEKALKGEEEE